jgi:hypothetical protein
MRASCWSTCLAETDFSSRVKSSVDARTFSLAIVCLITLATVAAADPAANSLTRARDAFQGQYKLADLFTPLGFSSDKDFAYFIGYNYSESDATFAGELQVLDLLDNHVVFEKDYEDNFREDEFHLILDRLGIKSQALVLRRFPFHKNGDTYSVNITSITLETDKENEKQKREYQIYLVSKKKGKKLVTKFEAEEFGGNAQVQYVVGFFQSPFENRIVILTEGLGGSLEGCTSIIHKVFGVHLGGGFKK